MLRHGLLELAETIKKGHDGDIDFSDPLGFRLIVFPPRIIIGGLERVRGNDSHIK